MKNILRTNFFKLASAFSEDRDSDNKHFFSRHVDAPVPTAKRQDNFDDCVIFQRERETLAALSGRDLSLQKYLAS